MHDDVFPLSVFEVQIALKKKKIIIIIIIIIMIIIITLFKCQMYLALLKVLTGETGVLSCRCIAFQFSRLKV